MKGRIRATKKQKANKRPAGKGAFDKMRIAASEIVMRNRGRQYRDGGIETVLFEFPFWCKFDKTFPKGVVVEKTLETNVRKINAVKLLNWLYDNGHSPYNVSMLVKQTTRFEMLENSVDKMFDIF
jgi:hypothetical protein